MLTPEQKAIFNKWVRDYQDEEHNPFTITLNQRELMIAEHAWEAALPPAVPQGWQPIETAPKGAKGYAWMQLAWGPEDDKNTGYGMHANGKFYAVATFHCLGQERQYQMREIEVVPTHWMPLPAAPAMAKEKA